MEKSIIIVVVFGVFVVLVVIMFILVFVIVFIIVIAVLRCGGCGGGGGVMGNDGWVEGDGGARMGWSCGWGGMKDEIGKGNGCPADGGDWKGERVTYWPG